MNTLKRLLRRLPDKSGYLMILPFYAIFLYFWLIPMFQVITDSFTDYSIFGDFGFVGLENYKTLLGDTYFKKSVVNTLVYTLGTLLPTLAIGFFAALLMNAKTVRTKLARTFLFIPHVVSMVAVSMVWLLIYNPNFGYMNGLLGLVGIPPLKWLQSPDTAMLGVVIMSVWKGIGYNMIINLSGLQSIPDSYYEVADLEGAGFWQRLRRITLPMMAPTLFFLFINGIISSFNVFEQVSVLTGGGPADSTTTIVHQIYINGFTHYKMGYASAQSVVLLLAVVVVTAVSFRFGNNQTDLEVG